MNTINEYTERLSGKVKWFNSKLGYGFITHIKDNKDVDVFVHWSNLLLNEKEFHTLYKGETVEFELEECLCNSKNDIGIQACKVSGPNSGKLLTSIHGDTSTYLQNVSRFSHIFQVRQLSVNEFSYSDNLSSKVKQIYSKNQRH
jgi:CspA family cold shock protein